MGRSLLERDGGYHLTDFVTKFIRGTSIARHLGLESRLILFSYRIAHFVGFGG